MATVAFPTVIAAVMTTADAPTDVRVVRGRDTSNDPGDVVMIGVSSLSTNQGWDSAGSFDQEFQTFGDKRVETGTVNALALSRNGDNDPDAACDAVFALVEELCAAVRTDPSLGVTAFDYLVTEVETGAVQESQNDEGAVATISLAFHYQART